MSPKIHPKQTSKTPSQASKNLVLVELEPLDIKKGPGSFCFLAGQMHVRDFNTLEKNIRWPISGHMSYLSLMKTGSEANGYLGRISLFCHYLLKEVGRLPFMFTFKCTLHFYLKTTSCSGQVNSCVLRICKNANIFKYHALSYLLTEWRHFKLQLTTRGKEGRSWGSSIFS